MHRRWTAALFALSLSLPAWATPAQAPDSKLTAILQKAITSHVSFKDRYDAEVWLMYMSPRLKPFVPDPARRIKLLKLIHYEAKRAGLSPELVLSVIQVESRFHQFAISNVGALGLMQVMPFWLKKIGKPHDNLFDIRTNLRIGCTILRYYMDMEHNDLTSALARYNGSLYSYKYTTRIYRALDNRWRCIDC